jgi:hypothetical protein
VNAIDFAHRKIVFDESSAITGRFDIRKYRMLERPLADLDDIRIKRMVWYKASSAMGTVALQVAMAWRLDQRPGNIVAVMQSDEDAKDWMATRGRKWLRRIDGLTDTMSAEKYNATLGRWLWPHQWLLVTGPGENAQQSKQCSYLFTDESHVKAFEEGDLASFEERMSKRWNRQALHVSTAADAGKEVDRYYYDGQQNEWHLRCPKCAELVWPLWEDDAKDFYNGEKVFRFDEHSASPEFVCPHCGATAQDNARERYALHEHGDYVPQNPSAPIETQSYRWSCFAAHWIPWAEALSKYREAIEAAKLGNLQPLENFEKKRLCKSYVPKLPDFGDTKTGGYKLGDAWDCGDSIRFLTVDFQAGKRGESSHFWCLVTQWKPNGDSRRVAYRKVLTWEDVRATQLEFDVQSRNVFVDSGHENRTVFLNCSRWKWFATRGTDEDQLYHKVKSKSGVELLAMPYGQATLENGNIGSSNARLKGVHLRGVAPEGWACCIAISNPQIYGYLHALHTGQSGRYFGIASDMPREYMDGFPAFIPTTETVRKTGISRIFWRKVKAFEHPWDCESVALMAAIRAGFYPLANVRTEPEPEKEIDAQEMAA